MQEQTAVKIASDLEQRIVAFLKTRQAVRMGLESKKAVVNRAVAEFLDKHGRISSSQEYEQLVTFFERNPELLDKMGFESTGQLVEAALKGLEKPTQVVKKR